MVIGAGIGGLAAAIRLAAAGLCRDRGRGAATPGGKMRALPIAAGPVDAGPDRPDPARRCSTPSSPLAGERLEDHLTLIAAADPRPALVAGWQPLDLYRRPRDRAPPRSRAFAGAASGAGLPPLRPADRAALYRAFDAPMMQAPEPQPARHPRAPRLPAPRIWPALLPGLTLAGLLRRQFRDPRLRQLFGRYATYVGGSPAHVAGACWR